MPEIWMDVNTALASVPVNMLALIDDGDFKSIEAAVVYNAAGMALFWNFTTTGGVTTVTAVTPTSAGTHDWTDFSTSGFYGIEIPASGGASISNDTAGFGWFNGVADGVLPWRGPVIGFRAAGLNNVLIDSAYSATRGLAGTALPAVAADGAGGLVISDAGNFDVDNRALAAGSVTRLDLHAADNALYASKYMGPRGPGIYLNDAASNTNTVAGTDGTFITPVSTIAAAKTLADAMSIDRVYLVNDSAITLAATMTDYEFVGLGEPDGNTIALASEDVSGSGFYNVTVSGVQGGSARALFEDCHLGVSTLHLLGRRCGLMDAASSGITFSNNDDNILEGCYSMVPGNTAPVLTCSAANLDLSIRHFSGGIEFVGTNATATITLETDGQVIFRSGCNVNTALSLRGMMTITDNTAGMNSLTTGAVYDKRADIASILVDTATTIPALISTAQDDLDTITGGDGVEIATGQTAAAWSALEASAGHMIECIVDTVTNTHTPTTTVFQSDTITEATPDHFNGRTVHFTSGVLNKQSTDITDYEAVGGIGQFTVTAMTEAPSDDDTFVIV